MNSNKRSNSKLKGFIAFALAFVLVIGCSFAYFTDYASTQVTGTAGTVEIELNSQINLLDPDGQDIINPGDNRSASFEVVNMGNKSIDVKTEIVLSVLSNFGHDLVLSGDNTNQSEYDLYYADDVELVEGEGWKPKAGAAPIAEKAIAEDGKSITYTLPIYALSGNSNEHLEVETVEGSYEFLKTENIVMLMNGQAGNLWQNSTVSIAVKVYAKQHENTAAGWDLVAFDAVDNTEDGNGTLVIDAMTSYGTRVGDIGITVSQVVDNGAAAAEAGEGQFDLVEIGSYNTTKTDKISIPDLKSGTYVITTSSAPRGYTVESDAVVVVTKDNITNKTLAVGVETKNNIVYSTIDADGNKLSDVPVTFESDKEYGEFKTNADGAIVLNGLKDNSTYTVTAPESVGELPILTDAVVEITAGDADTAVYGVISESEKVYSSLIGSTLYIASYEIPEMDGVEATEINDVTNSRKCVRSASAVNKIVIVDEVKPLRVIRWFSNLSSLTQIDNIENLNLSKACDASWMFSGCTQLTTLDLSNLDVSNLVNTSNMFSGCSALTELDLSGWDVGNVADMSSMFEGCYYLANITGISNWDVGNVVNMSDMFSGCKYSLTTLDLSNWNVGNVTDMSRMFSICQVLTTVGDLSGWNVANVTDTNNMFQNCRKLSTVGDLNGWNVSKLVNMDSMFYGRMSPLPDWYVD